MDRFEQIKSINVKTKKKYKYKSIRMKLYFICASMQSLCIKVQLQILLSVGQFNYISNRLHVAHAEFLFLPLYAGMNRATFIVLVKLIEHCTIAVIQQIIVLFGCEILPVLPDGDLSIFIHAQKFIGIYDWYWQTACVHCCQCVIVVYFSVDDSFEFKHIVMYWCIWNTS